jgi:protein-tyrosine phosphatase
VRAVLDLTGEFSELAPFRSVTYRNIPVLDLTAPTVGQLEEMAAFIETESQNGIVFVHCKIGYSRTAAAAAAYLLRTGQVRSVAEAIERLRQVRPTIVIRPEVLIALEKFTKEVSPRA